MARLPQSYWDEKVAKKKAKAERRKVLNAERRARLEARRMGGDVADASDGVVGRGGVAADGGTYRDGHGKTRSYTCLLCGEEGHSAIRCSLAIPMQRDTKPLPTVQEMRDATGSLHCPRKNLNLIAAGRCRAMREADGCECPNHLAYRGPLGIAKAEETEQAGGSE